ncbi:uncharacterized protein [Branchiostoma lanceolatum]|uniref:uncharacterized protein n=1 Tax=Branchiostoma lanceolatum TaxID=7740 RepID=UPI0034565793
MDLFYTLVLASVLLTVNCMPMKSIKEESEYDIRPEELDDSGALFESDIKLTPDQQLILDARIQEAQTGKGGRKGTANIAARWTGDVPYTLNSALSKYYYCCYCYYTAFTVSTVHVFNFAKKVVFSVLFVFIAAW